MHLPAGELVLAQAHFEAVASRRGGRTALRVAGQLVALHAVDAPRAGARPHAQAGLLRVNGEHRELRFGEGAYGCERWKDGNDGTMCQSYHGGAIPYRYAMPNVATLCVLE